MVDKVIEIVAEAIGVPVESLGANSSSGNVNGWDSLGHLAVLDGLDQAFPGITSRAPELSSAESVAEIVDILNRVN